jgi:hypothetical protein
MFNLKPKYSRETIDFIKDVGKLPIDREMLDQNVEAVLNFMQEYSQSLSIQRVCCHTLSNVCMDVQLAKEMVMRKHVHQHVIQTLKDFYERDWRLCWLGCSAIWNMSRSDQARFAFDLSTVCLLIKVAEVHTNKLCVVNTAIGSLSNLSLNNSFKKEIGEVENVLSLLAIVENNVDQVNIAATGIGLFANLAVNDNLADLLVDFGVIEIIKRMLTYQYDDAVFLRNSAAALSNCITSPIFVQECIKNKIIEHLAVTHADATNLGISALIANTQDALGIDNCQMTTSYHLAARHGLTPILYELIADLYENDHELDFNSKDLYGNSMISYAIENRHLKVISFLTICGSIIDENDMYHISHCPEIEQIIKRDRFTVLETRKKLTQLLITVTELNSHVITIVNQFLSTYSIMQNHSAEILL